MIEKYYKISNVKGREILDGRGIPTVEVDIVVNKEIFARAQVPSGNSVGSYEACELRDGGHRYSGKGVKAAVSHINEIIAPKIIGRNALNQRAIDNFLCELDGTANKSTLGANAILAVSLAVFKVASACQKKPIYKYINNQAINLPVPMINMLNGGANSSNDLNFQEFLVIPYGAKTFTEAICLSSEIKSLLREELINKYGKFAINVGSGGAFVSPIKSTKEALDLLKIVLDKTDFGEKFFFGLDIAANNLYNQKIGKYTIDGENYSREDMIDLYKNLISDYPIVSLEDPLHEDDFEGYSILSKELKNILIVGDDFFATNKNRLKKGIEMQSGNSLILKINQIGTITETLEVVSTAFQNNYNVIVSNRSGDTEESIIADLAVGLNTKLIKAGALERNERISNYNQLFRIEEELGERANYAGKEFKEILKKK